MKIFSKISPLVAVLAVVAVIAALLVTFWPKSDQKFVIADFPRTVSLYEGSDVKILGVAVGKVDSVTPTGTLVRVKLHYDSKYKIPEDAKAAVISPSIVGDRFVQLTPAYDGARSWPTMRDSASTAPRLPSSSTRSSAASTTSTSRWDPTGPTRPMPVAWDR